MEYVLETKQMAFYPKVRIYREWGVLERGQGQNELVDKIAEVLESTGKI